MQIEFNRIASDEVDLLCKKLSNKQFPGECPDQYVGEIAQICRQKEFDRKDIRDPGRSCVILILESPHVAEFGGETQGPAQGPAQGPTGINILTYLKEILKLDNPNVDKYKGYGLILMNAIQYQCSLGMPTEYFRDKIFCQLWKDGGESNFKERLKGTFQENDVLINCCTIGAKKRDLVTQSIRDISPKLGIEYLITGSHPSFWSVDKNRCEDKFEHIDFPINSR